MSSNIVDLERKIKDLKWLIKLRSMDLNSKLSEIVTYCPCCVARISRALWILSDVELALKLAVYEEQLITGINIDDIYEK